MNKTSAWKYVQNNKGLFFPPSFLRYVTFFFVSGFLKLAQLHRNPVCLSVNHSKPLNRRHYVNRQYLSLMFTNFRCYVENKMFPHKEALLLDNECKVILIGETAQDTKTMKQVRNRNIFQRGQINFPDFFPGVKCFFPVENFHFSTPKTFQWFWTVKSCKRKNKKTKQNKKQQQQQQQQQNKVLSSFSNFFLLPLSIFHLPFFDFPSFLLHFSFFLASLFPV